MSAPRHIPWLKVARTLISGRVPGQAVIQFTDACNARCGHCGMSVENRFSRSKLSTERVKGLLDKLAARGVMAVSLTGGEPLLYLDEVAECIRHARAAGMRSVRTGSNGFFLQGADKPGFRKRVGRYASALAESGCTAFWISLDSAVWTEHEAHRGLPGVVRGMREGLPIFHEQGLFPAANLCINRRMDAQTRDEPGAPFDPQAFYERYRRAFMLYFAHVLELGFTAANVCHPMLGDAFGAGDIVYQAASNEDFIRFRPEEKVPLYRALMDAVTLFRPRLRIFTPQSALLSMIRQGQGDPRQGYPCRGGLDFFFVDAAGMRVFPCGYRGGEDLTGLIDSGGKTDGRAQTCERCDWECFRDPSHLFGPLLELCANPLSLAQRFARDPEWLRLWLGDLRYLRSCGWFDARRPPAGKTHSSRRIHRAVATSSTKEAIGKSW